MARPLQLTILESREELEHRLDRQTTATGKERLQMVYWLKLGVVNSRTRWSSCCTRARQQLLGG